METNMELWDKVKTSDPKSLKEVAYGKRHFTAISAYHQIKKATELWGPVGGMWGWDLIGQSDIPQNKDLCIIGINLWVVTQNNNKVNGRCVVPVFGAAKWESDAPKKALTDAITKGLSYLGFNADIFLQELKWDGNKYVDTAKPRQNVGWSKVKGELKDAGKSDSVKLCSSFVEAIGLVDNKISLDAWAEEVSAAVQEGSISEKDKEILNKLYKTKYKEYL